MSFWRVGFVAMGTSDPSVLVIEMNEQLVQCFEWRIVCTACAEQVSRVSWVSDPEVGGNVRHGRAVLWTDWTWVVPKQAICGSGLKWVARRKRLAAVIRDRVWAGGGMRLGSLWACEEKDEPKRSFV